MMDKILQEQTQIDKDRPKLFFVLAQVEQNQQNRQNFSFCLIGGPRSLPLHSQVLINDENFDHHHHVHHYHVLHYRVHTFKLSNFQCWRYLALLLFTGFSCQIFSSAPLSLSTVRERDIITIMIHDFVFRQCEWGPQWQRVGRRGGLLSKQPDFGRALHL